MRRVCFQEVAERLLRLHYVTLHYVSRDKEAGGKRSFCRFTLAAAALRERRRPESRASAIWIMSDRDLVFYLGPINC